MICFSPFVIWRACSSVVEKRIFRILGGELIHQCSIHFSTYLQSRNKMEISCNRQILHLTERYEQVKDFNYWSFKMNENCDCSWVPWRWMIIFQSQGYQWKREGKMEAIKRLLEVAYIAHHGNERWKNITENSRTVNLSQKTSTEDILTF